MDSNRQMKNRVIAALLAGAVGLIVGGVAGVALAEDEFPIEILVGFGSTFAVVGFLAKEEWRDEIANWILDRLTP